MEGTGLTVDTMTRQIGGAFSNYYHPTRWHWSSVVRDSDAESNRGTASAGYTSKAFINCAVGEYVKFDYGF